MKGGGGVEGAISLTGLRETISPPAHDCTRDFESHALLPADQHEYLA